jgi:hypothetical protein
MHEKSRTRTPYSLAASRTKSARISKHLNGKAFDASAIPLRTVDFACKPPICTRFDIAREVNLASICCTIG